MTKVTVTANEIVKCDCRKCSRRTRHEVVNEIVEVAPEPWDHEITTWQLVRCLGCLTISFRKQYEDYSEVFQDHDGELQHTLDVRVYPAVIANHRDLDDVYLLPNLIGTVYKQTIKALGEQAYILASIGLRATIEAVCNDLKLSGASLERRIDQLHKAGHVSNGDKKRLHAIRFLGNDAAHQIKQPEYSELRVALEIVEHMLNTVYLLEHKARSLETAIETLDDFMALIEQCVIRFEGNVATNLVGLLGTQRRLIGQSIDPFEEHLKKRILDGSIKYLSLGSLQDMGEKKFQLYEVHKSELLENDFPF